MIPTLQFACSEDWEKMKIGLVSRHCERCDKEVFDFTKLSREEILLYLLQNRHKQACGRIFLSQIDYHHQDLVVVIESLISKNKNTNLAFYLLTIGSLFLLSCNQQSKKESSVINAQTPTAQVDSPSSRIDSVITAVSNNSIGTDTLEQKSHLQIPDLSIELDSSIALQSIAPSGDLILLGFMDLWSFEDPYQLADDLPPADPLGLHQPPSIAEVMPEFVGGFDSLVSFLRRNIKYPKEEKENSVEGTTYVSVIINADGKVSGPIILKSSTEKFDAEALRVVSLMPAWIPAENNGTKTAVRYVIPIKFKI